MFNNTLSVYIPRVFGPDNEHIKDNIIAEMLAQGIGEVSSVQVTESSQGHKQAFVHFTQWFDTPENAELQRQIYSGEAPKVSNGAIGYWFLKENTSADRNSPDPKVLVSQESMILQSKTIRDLRARVKELEASKDASPSISALASGWAKEREVARANGEYTPDLYELDSDVRRMWRMQSRSQPGTMRTVKWMRDGSWQCDCPATKECWHIKQCKLEVAGEIEADNAARKLSEAQAEIERLQDEVAGLKRIHELPPPPPLKRRQPPLSTHDEYEAIRELWEREGLEGEAGRVPALDQFRSVQFAEGETQYPEDLTAERMASQTEAFRRAMVAGDLHPRKWAEQSIPREILVDERGGSMTASIASEVQSELGEWRKSKDCNGGLGCGSE